MRVSCNKWYKNNDVIFLLTDPFKLRYLDLTAQYEIVRIAMISF